MTPEKHKNARIRIEAENSAYQNNLSGGSRARPADRGAAVRPPHKHATTFQVATAASVASVCKCGTDGNSAATCAPVYVLEFYVDLGKEGSPPYRSVYKPREPSGCTRRKLSGKHQ